MPVSTARREFAKSVIDRAVRRTLKGVHGQLRGGFQRLLWNVQSRSEMLRPSRFEGRITAAPAERVVRGLLGLAQYQKSWLRPTETWRPVGGTPLTLFSELAHHLTASYPVPPVMLQAWFGGTSDDAQAAQRWFLRVAAGASLRSVGFHVKLNRRMAFEFTKAPAAYSIAAALRWAQVKGLSGSEPLARAFARSAFVGRYVDDEFVNTVILFFMNQARLDGDTVAPITDYVCAQRCVGPEFKLGDEEICLVPPQPKFSMKGRTVASLLRLAAEWRAERDQAERHVLVRFAPSGLKGFRSVDEDGTPWLVRELLDTDELLAEGQAMHNCVLTYTRWCASGTSSIWSMAIEAPGDLERVLTIEVDNNRTVTQAKRPYNHSPEYRETRWLNQWIRAAGLRVSI